MSVFSEVKAQLGCELSQIEGHRVLLFGLEGYDVFKGYLSENIPSGQYGQIRVENLGEKVVDGGWIAPFESGPHGTDFEGSEW